MGYNVPLNWISTLNLGGSITKYWRNCAWKSINDDYPLRVLFGKKFNFRMREENIDKKRVWRHRLMIRKTIWAYGGYILKNWLDGKILQFLAITEKEIFPALQTPYDPDGHTSPVKGLNFDSNIENIIENIPNEIRISDSVGNRSISYIGYIL